MSGRMSLLNTVWGQARLKSGHAYRYSYPIKRGRLAASFINYRQLTWQYLVGPIEHSSVPNSTSGMQAYCVYYFETATRSLQSQV